MIYEVRYREHLVILRMKSRMVYIAFYIVVGKIQFYRY